MIHHSAARHSTIEPLEARITPASIIASADWKTATFGAPIALHAGEGLSTGGNAGSYLLYVEKGDALVFLTDLNNNGNVDFNEVTGIAAGDGLRLTSFVDIHGDIATNLVKTAANIGGTLTTVLTLSDSDNNGNNDPFNKIGDGRVLLNNSIEKIELRSLTANDLVDQNNDGVVDDVDVALRKANTTYSIFGSIYAGKSFGATDGGLIVDSTGATAFTVGSDGDFGFAANTVPSLGSIKTGTAASYEFFSYGASNLDDISGTFVKFTPPKGQVGGDIISVHAANTLMSYNLTGLFAGDGGIGARGGNIQDVVLTKDDTGGYQIVAGNGGRGPSGGVGGSIINFSDLASNTGKVVIKTGDGGVGATGAGGNGGTLSFETLNVFGDVNIALGSGGDGFRSGGNGASLVKGILSQPTATTFTPGNGVGTIHQSANPLNPGTYVANIGAQAGVDFDGDGKGDFVFTTKITNQLVVQLATGVRYDLSGARNAEALTVGDFNGDGHPDIAVASSDLGSQAGVVVFLSKFEDLNSNGLTSDEDLNGNGINDFLGFSAPRYSVLPQLDRGDPNTINDVLPSWQSPHQISALAAGDFDGDGKTELAAVVTFYGFKSTDTTTGAITALSGAFQTVVFLTPDSEFNNSTGVSELTGQFYADFGTKQITVAGNTIAAAPKAPFAIVSSGLTLGDAGSSDRTRIIIQATALTSGADHDVLFVGTRDITDIDVIDYKTRNNGTTPVYPNFIGTYDLGVVDIDRLLSVPPTATAPAVDHVKLVPMTLEDFTVADYDNDGIADLGAISASPAGYMVGVKGDGSGSGTQTSGPPITIGPSAQSGDNQGNYFYDLGLGYANNPKLLAIRSVDLNGDGSVDDFGIVVDTNTTPRGLVQVLHYQEGPQPPGAPFGSTTGAVDAGIVVGSVPKSPESFFDIRYATANDSTTAAFRTDGTFTLGNKGFNIIVGDGGNSIIGAGGIGGGIGGGAKFTSTTSKTTGLKTSTVTPSLSFLFDGANDLTLTAGGGGAGFSTGGKGGSITGVSVRADTGLVTNAGFGGIKANLFAGDGGRGVSGNGGDGGDLTQNTIQGGLRFEAGDGGTGRNGGSGGDVIGNGSFLLDGSGVSMTVVAGNGGSGDRKGGSGGAIVNFHPFVGSPGNDLSNTFLNYHSGNGGSGVSGVGGNGGSILNSSPLSGDGIQAEMLLQAGNGGTGFGGGVGGSIAKFAISPAATSFRPEMASFIAGNGGDATLSSGGSGGSVSDITVTTRGVNSRHSLTTYNFNRVLAGDGGDSSGAKGGRGGSVGNITSGATNGSFAIAAGAGGNGLTVGGDGGDVIGADIFLAASAATKSLVIAGIGGDATAFVVNSADGSANQGSNAFGGQLPGIKGKPGRAGDGGSISGYTQSGSIGAHVDLIAGNGGNTVNYGSIGDKVAPYVGKGGSIGNVITVGDVGNVTIDDPNTGTNENIPIKSYNSILTGETMAAWVNTNLRPSTGLANLDDNAGNVGIVVGAAGRNKAVVTNATDNKADPALYKTQPAQGGVNGSLINVEARNIMSAVAGNVDLIASIQVAKGIRVLKFVIGADKGVEGAIEYRGKNNNPISKPELDGRLVDGALIAKVILDSSGRPTSFPGGRIFNL